jgi:hypothetical protein
MAGRLRELAAHPVGRHSPGAADLASATIPAADHSGFEIRFHFCPNCGSSVFWEGDRSPMTCGIAVGCFADPDFPAPTSSGWEESIHPWLGLPPNTAHFRQSRS